MSYGGAGEGCKNYYYNHNCFLRKRKKNYENHDFRFTVGIKKPVTVPITDI